MARPRIIFEPTKGSQEFFLTCPAWEAMIHGNRGGGKTVSLIMDYLQDVGVGHGQDWRGILFRMTYTQLTDVISQTKQWIPQIFPSAKYNGSDHVWKFEGGEELLLRYIRTEDDYWQYHGWQLPWIGFEELTTWPTDGPYKKMMSCNRSANPNVPRKYRASTNPNGPGHAWVKTRFIDVAEPYEIYTDKHNQQRVHIPSRLEDNHHLLNADPLYMEKLKMLTQDNPNLEKAWIKGSWDLIAGGAVSDLWDRETHCKVPFKFPNSWKVFRSHDWGSAKPWANTYGAEANGEQPSDEVREMFNLPFIPAGSVIIIDEIYGWTGMPNEGDRALSSQIAERTLQKDVALCIEYELPKIHTGPADTSIWDVKDGKSIANEMRIHGLQWNKAYKGAGSRVAGLALIRQMLGAARRRDLEKPHLYFFTTAKHHIRTFPLLQYDPKKPEDVDTDQEDHAYDSTRYLLSRKMTTLKRKRVRT